MSDQISDDGSALIQARCEICRYVRKIRALPTDIQTQLMCFRFPPNASALPTQGGTVVLTARPIVTPQDMCFEFKHDPKKLAEAPLMPTAANEPGN